MVCQLGFADGLTFLPLSISFSNWRTRFYIYEPYLMAYREVFGRVSRAFSVSLFEGRTGSLSLIAISSSLSLLLSKICDKISVSVATETGTITWSSTAKKLQPIRFLVLRQGVFLIAHLINSLNGLSSSVKATCWLESLIPALEKHLMMTCGGTALQDDTKVAMAWRIEILGSGWFLFNALIHILTTSRRYWALRLLITPWSVGWSTEYLSGGRNKSFTLVRFEIVTIVRAVIY